MNMTHAMNKLYLCLIALFLFTWAVLCRAQVQAEQFLWATAGGGGCSIGDGGGCLNLNGTYQNNKNLLTLRLLGGGELFGKSLGDYSVCYGRALTQSTFLLAIGGGIGFVQGEISSGLFSREEPKKIPTTIGLPLEAQIFWRPFSFAGIGLYGFANINSEESFYGCNLAVQVGKVR
ncbi:hypothetical protein JXO59_02740 [candidate division KSB1 bacterium]|nr:hypothetical protein [candidate division KSB1 bacterium]